MKCGVLRGGLVLAGICACASAPSEGSADGSGGIQPDPDTAAGPGAEAGMTRGGEDAGSATGAFPGPEKLDLPSFPGLDGGGGDEPAGCRNLDFLFVIDSSNSMATNQAELIASFPQFVDAIAGTLVNVDSFHVGVVTSDAYAFNDPDCRQMGALVTQTGGKDSGDETCGPYAEGFRYMTEEDDLAEAFSCAARVGTDGANDEAMMAGAMGAMSPELAAADACNAGFLRDDALLVVTFITDEDDPGTCVNVDQGCMGSDGEPSDWYAAFLDAKGFAENFVVLSLVRGVPGNACGDPQGTERDGDRLMEFTGLHGDLGLVGDICASSFGAFFEQAVDLVDQGCTGFVSPVG